MIRFTGEKQLVLIVLVEVEGADGAGEVSAVTTDGATAVVGVVTLFIGVEIEAPLSIEWLES